MVLLLCSALLSFDVHLSAVKDSEECGAGCSCKDLQKGGSSDLAFYGSKSLLISKGVSFLLYKSKNQALTKQRAAQSSGICRKDTLDESRAVKTGLKDCFHFSRDMCMQRCISCACSNSVSLKQVKNSCLNTPYSKMQKDNVAVTFT